MSRKQFIESQGATCQNWTWSWSFINEEEKVIIFGAWDLNTVGSSSQILSEDWRISRKGRKQPAYEQSREHIRLVEEEGFQLKTFPMTYSKANEEDDTGPAKIDGFVPELTEKTMKRVGNNWYASDDALNSLLTEEIEAPEKYSEGASKTVTVNTYERDSHARTKCLEHHGFKCAVCSFDFEAVYGEIGRNFIHVHHVIPLAEIGMVYDLSPITDLIPVCPNCHAIIHRTRPALTVKQLKEHLLVN